MQQYIHIHKPGFCIAENVDQLREDGSEESDLAQILAWFSKEGYFVKDFTICAENYGSLAVRKRLYVVALLITDNPNPSAQMTFIRKMLDCVRDCPEHWHKSFSVNDFLLESYHMYAARPNKKQRVGEIYEEEHASHYAAFSLPWPPGNRDIELVCGEEVLRNLSGRSAEVVHFCCKAFEMQCDTEFLDANRSLAWLCTSKDKSPWFSPGMFTLTGSCIPIIRQRRDQPLAPSVRLMTGVEAMQFMGWDITDFRDIDALSELPNSNAFLCNLAGNVFLHTP